MPAAKGRRPPVTLRDFLELGCESSSDGFRSYPRCRPRDEAELSRSPSWSPSAFFVTKSSGALARISSLSRSLSRRISFWRRREFDDLLDDRDSCGFPSPLVSSCSASESSEYDESETDIVIEETSAAVYESVSALVSESVSASSSSADRDCTDVPGAPGDGHDEALGDGDLAVGRNSEEKRQLSPVSVLDFPFDDDDDGDEEERSDAGTCFSPSFLQHRSHSCDAANLQRKKKKIAQHKFRRFDDGPTTASVVDLEARFTSTLEPGEESVDDDAHLPSNYSCGTDDTEAAANTTAPRHDNELERPQDQSQEPDDEYRLLARLLDDDTAAAAVGEISEWLLLDFFAEGIGRCSMAGPVVGTTTTGKKPLDGVDKVTAALDWLRGAGPQWGIGDVMFSGASALKDMERGRRWMCVREEEQDIGAEVEAVVMDGLLDELATELIMGLPAAGTTAP